MRRSGAACSDSSVSISIGFQFFMLATSNPFTRLMPAAAEGLDLNPLLQDFALAVHPPILYLGYVGFSVAFAFACATLLEGRLDAAWARWTRPWTLAAWLFLTIGIALGSWWRITSWGGEAGGSGTQSRMRPSCRGSPARR